MILGPRHFIEVTGLEDRKPEPDRPAPRHQALLDALRGDMILGIAVQDHLRTREELEEYCLAEGLVPWLRPFLERRGWLDADWEDRLARLEARTRQ